MLDPEVLQDLAYLERATTAKGLLQHYQRTLMPYFLFLLIVIIFLILYCISMSLTIFPNKMDEVKSTCATKTTCRPCIFLLAQNREHGSDEEEPRAELAGIRQERME